MKYNRLNESLVQRYDLSEDFEETFAASKYFDKYEYDLGSADRFEMYEVLSSMKEELDYSINSELEFFNIYISPLSDNKFYINFSANDSVKIGDYTYDVISILSSNFVRDYAEADRDPDKFKSDYEIVYNDILNEISIINNDLLPRLAGDWGFVKVSGANKNSFAEKLESLLEDMSPEDERDSALIKSIIDKTFLRNNARLTKEEQEILKKYGLSRSNNRVWIDDVYPSFKSDISSDRSISNKHSINYRDPQWYKHRPRPLDKGQINYADLIRQRKQKHLETQTAIEDDKLNQYARDRYDLSQEIWQRDHHQRYVDEQDSTYEAAIQKATQEFERAVAAAEKARDDAAGYHTDRANRARDSIQKIFDKYKK